MRPAVIIAVLLGINLALGATVGYLVYVIQQQSAPRPAEPRKLPIIPRRIISKPIRPPLVTAAAPRPQEFNWAQVESTDFKNYIANLRAIHCPEETIRDIIVAEVEKLYAARRQALFPPRKDVAYWLTGNASIENEWGDREKQKQLHLLDKEKRDLLVELLGFDAQAEVQKLYGSDAYADFHLSFLSEQKQDQVRAVLQKFQEQEQELYQQSEPDMLDEDQVKFRDELRRIAREKQAELAKILTPEEIEKYELLSSDTAVQMRSDLTGFSPSPDEFKAIFKVRKKYEEEFAANPNGPPLEEQNEGARVAMETELRGVLGEARYSEYQRTQDEAYRTAAAVVEKLNLPKEAAVKDYAVKQVADQEAQRVLNNARLAPEQQQAALRAITDETAKALRQTLGDKGYQAYQRNGGAWVQGYSEAGAATGSELWNRYGLGPTQP